MFVLPIILVSDDPDIEMYESTEDLLRSVEMIDVENGVHVAYGADGTLLSQTVEEGRIRLDEAEDMPLHAEALAEILRKYLIRIGMPRPLADRYSLLGLVSTSIPYLMQDLRPVSILQLLWRLAKSLFIGRTTKKWTPSPTGDAGASWKGGCHL